MNYKRAYANYPLDFSQTIIDLDYIMLGRK